MFFIVIFGYGQYPPISHPFALPFYNTQANDGQNPYAYYPPPQQYPIVYVQQPPYMNGNPYGTYSPDVNGIQSIAQIPSNYSPPNPYIDDIKPTFYNDNEIWSESYISKPEIQGNYLKNLDNTEEYFVRIAGSDKNLLSDYNYASVDWSQCNTILRPVTEFIGCAYGQFGGNTPLMCNR